MSKWTNPDSPHAVALVIGGVIAIALVAGSLTYMAASRLIDAPAHIEEN